MPKILPRREFFQSYRLCAGRSGWTGGSLYPVKLPKGVKVDLRWPCSEDAPHHARKCCCGGICHAKGYQDRMTCCARLESHASAGNDRPFTQRLPGSLDGTFHAQSVQLHAIVLLYDLRPHKRPAISLPRAQDHLPGCQNCSLWIFPAPPTKCCICLLAHSPI